MNKNQSNNEALAKSPGGKVAKKKVEGGWTDASKELPPEGEYVLIHVTRDNWIDHTDPNGVYFKVAKLERGISMAEREKMKAGELPDPEVEGWIMPNNKLTCITSKRSANYRRADEHANNLRPYLWAAFGPDIYFGQEVDYWQRINRSIW